MVPRLKKDHGKGKTDFMKEIVKEISSRPPFIRETKKVDFYEIK